MYRNVINIHAITDKHVEAESQYGMAPPKYVNHTPYKDMAIAIYIITNPRLGLLMDLIITVPVSSFSFFFQK